VLSSATTDAAGRFTLRGLPRRFSIYAAAAGHHARIVGGVEVASGVTAGPIEVRLRALTPGEEPRVELAGIGAVLAARGEGLVVATVVAGGGAAEAGLTPGDLILSVDGRAVVELGMTGAIDAIRGPEGTFVLLTVRRDEGATRDVRVVRRLVRG
jgi:S1-C subfamily serine protease